MVALAEFPVQSESEDGADGANGHAANGIAQHGGAVAKSLSADEMALYDRQIRLWGAQAQQHIRSAHILLVSLRALGTEIAKNLVLAGISSLTIIDEDPVAEEDLGAQFFLRQDDIGKPRGQAAAPRIQELNPRVNVRVDGGIQALLTKDGSYYVPFDCIIACDHDFMTLSLINAGARFASRPFYAAGIHGFYGFIFADLIFHEFVIEREKSNKQTALAMESMTRSVISVTSKKENDGKTIEVVKKMESYCPLLLANSSPLPHEVMSKPRQLKQVPALLPCLRALFEFQRQHGRLPGPQQQDLAAFSTLVNEKSQELQLPPDTVRGDFLRSFMANIGSEITPTAAFVGGRLSEDVINVIGKREQPIQNFALFDGESFEARIYSLFTMPPELAMGMNPSLGMDISNNVPVDMSGMDGLDGIVQMPDMLSNIGFDISTMQEQGQTTGGLGRTLAETYEPVTAQASTEQGNNRTSP